MAKRKPAADLPETVYSREVEHDGENDAGSLFKVQCPTCGDTITCSVPGRGWWDKSCRCGYEWDVTITARGDLPRKD